MVAIVVAGLALVGAAAGVYFLVLNKPAELTGPEAAVVKFFEAVGRGDTEGLAALFTPDSRPGEPELRLISLMFGNNKITMGDVETRVVSESGTDAQVEVTDITMAVAGRKVRMSDLGTEKTFDFKLKKVNGEWLIEAGGRVPFIPSPDQMPLPTTPSTGI